MSKDIPPFVMASGNFAKLYGLNLIGLKRRGFNEETIKALHSPRFIEHPSCREGVIDGNPLHEELLEIAGLAGHDFMLNVSLDADRRITGIFAGDPVVAHVGGYLEQRIRLERARAENARRQEDDRPLSTG